MEPTENQRDISDFLSENKETIGSDGRNDGPGLEPCFGILLIFKYEGKYHTILIHHSHATEIKKEHKYSIFSQLIQLLQIISSWASTLCANIFSNRSNLHRILCTSILLSAIRSCNDH
jgi:hypothetical protein